MPLHPVAPVAPVAPATPFAAATPRRWMRTALGAAALALISACGGGGGGDEATASQTPPPAQAQAVRLTGVVATGAAFEGSTVTVYDRTAAVVGTTAEVGADGVFTVTLAEAAQAPFVLVASRTQASGEVQALYSVAPEAADATVNVTPVTSLVTALLSPTGNPEALVSALANEPSRVSSSAVSSTVQQVSTLLAPALAATGVSNTINPFTANFSANGSGYDRLLDTLNITITPNGSSSNIEVGFRVAQADPTAQPPVIQFSSATSLSATEVTGQVSSAAAAVTADAVVPDGTTAKIASLLARLTACYALPLTQRVSSAANDSTAATGNASHVTASACREVFVGGDPANYLSNGGRVGRNASNAGAFSGLFRPGATGVVFSQGTYEFTRTNGDLVVGYKTRDAAGSEAFDSLVVRLDTADGQLKLVGNQYAYPGGVSAYHQRRQFVGNDSTGAGQSAYDYYSTGVALSVSNVVNGSGNPVFNRVVVTSPRNDTLTLKPSSGQSFLTLVKSNGTNTGTSFLRLRSEFINPATSGHPCSSDSTLFFAPTDFSEAQIAAIPHQSVWKFEYFLAGNTGSTPDAVQHYKTRARALTLSELKTKGLAELTPSTLSTLLAAPQLNSQLKLPSAATLSGLGYTVGSGALPPTQARLWGRLAVNGTLSGASFDDIGTMPSSARSAAISCSLATSSDGHCGEGGAYADNAYMNGLHLWARDVAGREYAQFYAFYRLR